ncbi:CotH kinase family protein [Patiriisocius sp. Uisw_047]|uniref:CotH kinase family protein n=1 Tax=Patiriisocius sp. Uisw_047 TaxID=3230969 RepID=UPI0039ED8922
MNKKLILLQLFFMLFWQVSFAQQTILNDSNLPIMVISTDIDPATNAPYDIPDEPKLLATMQLIYRPDGTRNYLSDITNDSFLNYNGRIGIELRGSSSQTLDKKPYGFTTLLEDDDSNNNISLVGMPSENDWVLNSLAFDPSMIRDYLSYTLASNMGNYAPRVKYIELIVNDDYKGVYILTEKVKRDSDRVNLKKIADSDTSFPEVTGGYIVKADKVTGGDEVAWTMPNYGGWDTNFLHHYPKTEDIIGQQASYIENIFYDLAAQTNPVNTSITNGYPSIIDVPSFVDYMIVAEIASNPDSYELSTYFHKDRGGKLRAGPIWDYNFSFGNDLFIFGFDRSFYDVWQFELENTGAKFWKDLFLDETFNCYLAKRWIELTAVNQTLNYLTITNLIDEYSNLLSESQVRELQRWPSQDNWPTVADQTENIIAMKDWIQNRINWMNTNIGSLNNCLDVSVPDLVISKIHYNPLEDGGYSSKELEFIEITNTSNESIDLTGYYIRELGISYQFPANASVTGNEKIYLSNDATVFENYYGFTPLGSFTRELSNSSYEIILSDAFGNSIDEVAYTDSAPWPEDADGTGPYLQLIDLNSDNSLASNWIASTQPLSIEDLASSQQQIAVYPNPTKGFVTIKLNTSKTEPLEFAIYNSLGQSVGEFKLNSNNLQLNLSHLSNGFYYYNIKNKGGVILRNKIIKE